MPNAGKVTIVPRYDGVPFVFERLEGVFYVLATAAHETSHDYAVEMVQEARRQLAEHGRSECKMRMQQFGQLLPSVTLHIQEVDGIYVLYIRNNDQLRSRNTPLELVVANALEVEGVLHSMQVELSLPVVGQDRFVLDYGPIMDAMRSLNLHPAPHCELSAMTGLAAADLLMQQASDGGRSAGHSLTLDTPLPGWNVFITAYGCRFSTWSSVATIVHCRQDGSVISGPLDTKFLGDELVQPVLNFAIGWQQGVSENDSPVPLLTTPRLQQPLRDLAARIAAALER